MHASLEGIVPTPGVTMTGAPIMFETVVPDLAARRSRRVFYESLPMSLAVHAMAVAGVALAVLTHVTFPAQPPRLMLSYLLFEEAASIPPPPPLARGPTPPKPPDPQPTPTAPTVLPQMIPEQIPLLTPVTAVAEPPREVSAASEGLGDGFGSGGGSPAGAADGVAGGIAGGIKGGVLMQDGRVHFGIHALLPMV